MYKYILFLSTALLVVGCGDNNDRIKENAQIQGEEGARKAVEAENSNRDKRVAEREADLQRRLLYYAALTGKDSVAVYTGKDSFGYDVRLILTFAGSYYVPNRVRSLEEVEKQIAGLSLNIDVDFFDPTDAKGNFKCEAIGIEPKLETGLIQFKPHNKECPFNFYLSADANLISENEEPRPSSNTKQMNDIFGGHVKTIRELAVLEYSFDPKPNRYILTREEK